MTTKKKYVAPENEISSLAESRREFFKESGLLTGLALTPDTLLKAADSKWDEKIASAFEKVPVNLTINGVKQKLSVEPRVPLLDLLPGFRPFYDSPLCLHP